MQSHGHEISVTTWFVCPVAVKTTESRPCRPSVTTPYTSHLGIHPRALQL